ncbi:hypothetical protein L1049_004814 [Liquidambar formosana]|uniref:Reverse transcriptase zinc-binding domain-containing protein n=1 Tax=Liquidambar formosana TaxID=63359 RepID=A0AAP0WYJ3_LIQFO
MDHLRRSQGNVTGESSTSAPAQDECNFIWKQMVLNKVKHFAWRAVKGILPTREGLARRKVVEDPLCPLCGQAEESIVHCLRDCPFAKRVWQVSGLDWQGSGSWLLDFRGWWNALHQHADKEVFAQMLMTLWAIWNGRNKWVFEGIREEPCVLAGKAGILWQDFMEAVAKQETPSRSGLLVRWRPSRAGVFKINVDRCIV